MSVLVKSAPVTDLDAEDLIARINALAIERAALYRKASDGWSPEQRDRMKALKEELDALWLQRRQVRAGRDDVSEVVVRQAA